MRPPELTLALILPLLVAGAARADPSPETRLKSVEQAIDESRARQDEAAKAAAALAAEIAQLQAQSVAAAGAAQADEVTLTAIEAQLAKLVADERAKSAALARDSQRETALLMALVRVAATPGEALALAPRPPLDTVRGALLMARAVPPLEARSTGLRQEIDALEASRRDIAAAEAQQADERQALSGEEARIAQLVARKTALRDTAARTAEDSGKRLVALAAEASSMRDLIDRIEAERRKAEEERAAPQGAAGPVAVTAPAPLRLDPAAPRKMRPFAAARGAMVYPASGTLVARFGAPDENGAPGRGLTFETRPGAEIVAPFDGQIVFAGPFRGYGQIVIIAHGDGYHSLLAGLDRVDSAVGQWLVAGEPVGRMADGADPPRLYLELRHDNQPINPAPWLMSSPHQPRARE